MLSDTELDEENPLTYWEHYEENNIKLDLLSCIYCGSVHQIYLVEDSYYVCRSCAENRELEE